MNAVRRTMRAISALTIVVFLLNGCTSWTNVSVADLQEDQDYVRVQMVGGTHVDVHNVTVREDSLFGTVKRGTTEEWDKQVAYSMDHVLEIQKRVPDSEDTFALMLVGTLVVSAIVWTNHDWSGLDGGSN